MKIIDAINHNWKKGDKVWAVIYGDIANEDFILIPVEVRQMTVSKVTKRDFSDNLHELIIDFEGYDNYEDDFEGYGEYADSINKYFKIQYCDEYIKLLEHRPDLSENSGTINVETKFFNKSEALEKLVQLSAEVKKKLVNKIYDYNIEADSLQEQLNVINDKINKMQIIVNKIGID